MVSLLHLLTLGLATGVTASPPKPAPPNKAVTSITCNSESYSYDGLAGFGSLPSTARDQFGDTISIGSSMAVKNWKKIGKSYKGTLFGLPDRGWNTNGTQNTIPRVHVFDIMFTPAQEASVDKPEGPNLEFTYLRSIPLSDPSGNPMTGLDATDSVSLPGFPPLPAATYPGDGFGGPGTGGQRLTIDAEGLVVNDDNSFYISDEYGPYIYHFSPSGRMTAAIRPPDALIPVRNGTQNFNSNTPPIYDKLQVPKPADPGHGRQNNQGFEGLTISPDGRTLWVMLQSAARQEGGASSSKRRMTRFLKYSLTNPKEGKGKGKGKAKKVCRGPEEVEATLEAEYVVPLPTYLNAENATRVAAQSEIKYISDTQFLVLARDSSGGRGQKDPLSRYRHIDVVDISAATDIKGKYDDISNGNTTAGGIVTPSDVLVPGITPAQLCPFVDYNINSELGKFKAANGDVVHNGAPVNLGLLNEKWESLALLPVNNNQDKGRDEKDEYYLITLSDNDFITDDGYMNFGKIRYSDGSATVPSLDSQALVFRVTLPRGSRPLVG